MTRITIPPAAIEAGARAIGEETYISNKETQKAAARAAFEAMVEAWPGMQHRIHIEQAIIIKQEIILPLTENPDVEA